MLERQSIQLTNKNIFHKNLDRPRPEARDSKTEAAFDTIQQYELNQYEKGERVITFGY